MFEPPPSFDGFRVERPLGRGGMGHVYLGRDVDLDRLVALKFVAANDAGSKARERFKNEARAIARLSNPNVVSIYRIGEVNDQPYIAYELVRGESLDHAAMPMPWAQALRVAGGIARGLTAVHRAGICHRDLKPANVMLSDAGVVKLIDFGLAILDGEHHKEGSLAGTPAYMAPEVWVGEPATTRSDIFAFGVTLYELLVGNAGESPREPIWKKRPDVPESFAAVINRCLRDDPAERFADAAELRQTLDTAERIFLQGLTNTGAGNIVLGADVLAVASSLLRVKDKSSGVGLVHAIYDRLFQRAPDLRPLFPPDMSAQEKKLSHMLELAVASHATPGKLEPMLADLGKRHVGYGARPEHFTHLWSAMLETFADLDDGWSTELDVAWRGAFGVLERAMLRGMAPDKSTITSERAG